MAIKEGDFVRLNFTGKIKANSNHCWRKSFIKSY